jgi:hypothetical protein
VGYITRKESASAETSPFSEAREFQSLHHKPEATRPHLDQPQPHTDVRRRDGRPIILETCNRVGCGRTGECVDTGEEILCLGCVSARE